MIRPDLMRRVTAGDAGRLLLALLWMPFGALGGIVVASAAEGAFGGAVEAREDIGTTLKIWFFVLLAAPMYLAPLTTLVGLPAHVLLVAMGLPRWPAYGTLGSVVGAAFAAALAPSIGLPLPSSDPASLAFIGGAAGLGGALAFWAVLRPDQGRAEHGANDG